MADNTNSTGSFSTLVDWQRCSAEEQRQLLTRPPFPRQTALPPSSATF